MTWPYVLRDSGVSQILMNIALARATKVKSNASLSAGGANGTTTTDPDSTSAAGSTLARRLKNSPASSDDVATTDAACSNYRSRPPEKCSLKKSSFICRVRQRSNNCAHNSHKQMRGWNTHFEYDYHSAPRRSSKNERLRYTADILHVCTPPGVPSPALLSPSRLVPIMTLIPSYEDRYLYHK